MLHSTLLAFGVVALSHVHVEAQSDMRNSTKDCEPYFYPVIANSLGSFPPIWLPASILPGDNAAQQKWDSIKANVPNTATRGISQGIFESTGYGDDDPDCWWTWSKCTNPKAPGIPPDVSVMPEPRTLGYGFDDGPNCSHNSFYDYLAKENQKATMFYIGSNVMDWPREAARGVTDGHEVCVHGWSHQYMTSLQSEDAFAELYYTMQVIKLATGVTPTCWRPPFGDVDDRIRAISHGLNLRTILWQYDSQDWQVDATTDYTPEMVYREYQTMIDDANKGMFDKIGTMILMHELNEFTMMTAQTFHPKLKQAFYRIVPVAVGLNITQPYVEQDHTLPSFAEYGKTGTNLVTNGTSATNSSTPATSPIASPSPAVRQTAGAWATPSGNARVVAALVLGFIGVLGIGVIH